VNAAPPNQVVVEGHLSSTSWNAMPVLPFVVGTSRSQIVYLKRPRKETRLARLLILGELDRLTVASASDIPPKPCLLDSIGDLEFDTA
jgi:hypothetical protein